MIKQVILRETANDGENTKNYESRVPAVNFATDPTNPFDTALWARIQTSGFEPPETKFTFAIRLARETDWTLAFADQAIHEYRRFLYLAVRAGHPITPILRKTSRRKGPGCVSRLGAAIRPGNQKVRLLFGASLAQTLVRSGRYV